MNKFFNELGLVLISFFIFAAGMTYGFEERDYQIELRAAITNFLYGEQQLSRQALRHGELKWIRIRDISPEEKFRARMAALKEKHRTLWLIDTYDR